MEGLICKGAYTPPVTGLVLFKICFTFSDILLDFKMS